MQMKSSGNRKVRTEHQVLGPVIGGGDGIFRALVNSGRGTQPLVDRLPALRTGVFRSAGVGREGCPVR